MGKAIVPNRNGYRMSQTLLPALPTPTKREHRRIGAALLYAFAAMTCSLTAWATPGDSEPDGSAPLGQCVGAAPAQVAYPFSDYYSCVSLGTVPGVPISYGGVTF